MDQLLDVVEGARDVAPSEWAELVIGSGHGVGPCMCIGNDGVAGSDGVPWVPPVSPED